jgi:hypothetical protein
VSFAEPPSTKKTESLASPTEKITCRLRKKTVFLADRLFVMKSKAPRLDCEPSDLVTALGTMSGKWKVRIICLLLDGHKTIQRTDPLPHMRRYAGGEVWT